MIIFFLKCTHQEIISLPSKNVRLRILLDVCAEQKYMICSFDNSVNFPKLQHYLDFAMQNSHNSLLILTQTTVNLFIKNKLALAREYCAAWRRTVTNQQQIHLTWCTQQRNFIVLLILAFIFRYFVYFWMGSIRGICLVWRVEDALLRKTDARTHRCFTRYFELTC